MKQINNLLFLSLIFLLAGCVSTNSYVDPNFSFATYDEITPVQEKYLAKITVEFQRNGKVYPRGHQETESHVIRTFRATGIVTPSKNSSNITIHVIVNNIAEIGKAFAKGFGTGLTFGAAGSAVTDYYEIEISYKSQSGQSLTQEYKHALHTTVGQKKAPIQNVAPTSIADGYGKIIEDAILNFVKDMQRKGDLSFNLIEDPSSSKNTNNIFIIKKVASTKETSQSNKPELIAGNY